MSTEEGHRRDRLINNTLFCLSTAVRIKFAVLTCQIHSSKAEILEYLLKYNL